MDKIKSHNIPSVRNVILPGQYSPYIRSNIGIIFYLSALFFIIIAIIIYFMGSRIGSGGLRYVIPSFIVLIGIFISDKIQSVYDSQGALILHESGVDGRSNLIQPNYTNSQTGSLPSSGIRQSFSLWVYDNESESKSERGLLSRNFYTNDTVLENSELNQYISPQPSISLSRHNSVIYALQDPTSNDPMDVKQCVSHTTIPKKQWTCIQIIQTERDASIYIGGKLDSVHTFKPIDTTDLIAKGSFVLFPTERRQDEFKGMISRIYYWNVPITPTVQQSVFELGPVRGNILYELVKSIMAIPYNLVTAAFVS